MPGNQASLMPLTLGCVLELDSVGGGDGLSVT
jgi:hypothetical protein